MDKKKKYISNTLQNSGHKELRLFWEQSGVLRTAHYKHGVPNKVASKSVYLNLNNNTFIVIWQVQSFGEWKSPYLPPSFISTI